ncbi:MAG: hypothetical protein QF486_01685 [Candidatus Woesearchaeota archaeon]|jgi:hypothetical protein|nr:hypothetical protein [Candidatus Woesearchaeota archaeon]MDP7181076.1 hypothetical protein [Candidatus Woesearchaeota archaeon]MDP7198303.1 hypothetical protein [Candidatus Woesearchaeota archaeon]MDP7467405.1 hypothetical protein [Candidatus Woesearchaeota archaeon]MDP7647632.1 hypothetical protein [Candidatus Woesearchaeota archaeon]
MGEFEAELEEYISQRRKGSLMSFIASKKIEKEQPPEEEKKGIFSKMFGEKPKPQDLKADLKDVAKIAFNAMQRLPPAEVEEFKRSADYAYFKEILAKHDLIK